MKGAQSMNFHPNVHRRHPSHLREYDYAQARAYFLTICVKDLAPIFGQVEYGRMRPNVFGNVTLACWNDLPNQYAHVRLDAFVLMPNHVHGIIELTNEPDVHTDATTDCFETNTASLPEMIRAFKILSARRINEMRNTLGQGVWQRSYYEHMIRDRRELQYMRDYISSNPSRSAVDRLHPNSNRALPGRF